MPNMKRIACGFYLFFSVLHLRSQGLEKIVVEKYYVSDANDEKAKLGGHLPAGSVTYRIYADMLPGYRFQAAYGVEGHELRIATTTLFFNNDDRGAIIPNIIPKFNLENNTVMLDSWLSVGAASELNFGILKSEDDTIETVVNADIPKVLQNADPLAGVPVKVKDGLMAGVPQRVTIFGIDSIIDVFGTQTKGSLFSTDNGSWACLVGAVGPTSDNKVLIAQLTTDGVFSFELNIQIGGPDRQVENYVARNPVNKEILLPSLTYSTQTVKAEKPVKLKTKGKK